jgi:hypothetical protein
MSSSATRAASGRRCRRGARRGRAEGPRLTADVTPRYCEADPFEGGKQAVAEAWRNITAVGGKPLAITDNLNFGNPERPEIMGQFVGCLRGIGEACARWTSRSCPATSRSTTRPTAAASCRRRPSAASACSTISPNPRRSPSRPRASDPADRRDAGLARPVGLSARRLRPRGGRAAAGRSRRREAQRRRGARHDPCAARHRRARPLGRRPARRARRDGDGRRHWRDAGCRARGEMVPHAWWFGEDQARYVVTVPERRRLTAVWRCACRS